MKRHIPPKKPRISVIMPVFNRNDEMALCLDGILKQKITSSFEIIVVDDASTDDTPAQIELYRGLARKKSITLRPVYLEKNLGSAQARNAGIAAARGQAIAFIDSDCIPQDDWLEHLTRPVLDSAWAVQGTSLGLPGNVWQNLTQESYSTYQKSFCRGDRAFGLDTRNCALRKELFERVGMFRTRFAGDLDMGWRIMASGIEIRYAPRAIIHHEHRDSLLKDVRANFRSAKFMPLIMLKNRRMNIYFVCRSLFGAATPPIVLASPFLGAYGLIALSALAAIYIAFSLRGKPSLLLPRIIYKLAQAVGSGYGFVLGVILTLFEWRLRRYGSDAENHDIPKNTHRD